MLYLRYKRCESIDAFSALVRSITADARWTQLSRVVVVLRGNYGGSSNVYRPFLETCRSNPAAVRPGAFQVLTDRATISAAIEALLESKAIGARSLGETTGQRPNFMASSVPFTSGRLQLSFSRATLCWSRRRPERARAGPPSDWKLHLVGQRREDCSVAAPTSSRAGNKTRAMILFVGDSRLKAPPVKTTSSSRVGTM